MDHYLNIKVLPDLETSAPVLMNNLFSKLHRQLGQKGQRRVGISFPFVQNLLGDVVRLHGTEQDLKTVMEDNWLKGLRDYTVCSQILPVPEDVMEHRTVRRVQAKSAQNKRKRSIVKGWLSEEAAYHSIPDSQQTRLRLPYLQIQSLSNRNVMRVYVEHGPIGSVSIEGSFNSYGLSSMATIPWF